MHAVVARGGQQDGGRVVLRRIEQVVGREGADVFPLFRLVRIAVFGHPRRAGQQLVVALHVQQRHLDHHRTEQFRVLREHVAGEQAAVAAAADAKVLWRGDLAVDHVARDRGEILVGLVPVLLQRRLVPARAVLAAAADVGDRVDAALLQPALAHATRIAGRQRDLEAAVAVKQGRIAAVMGHVLRSNQEVRHAGAVLRGREMLLDRVLRRVEERRHGLERFGRGSRGAGIGQHQRGWSQVVGDRQPQRIRLVRVDRADADGAEGRHARQRPPLPSIRARRQDRQPVLDVVQHVEHEVVLRERGARERGGFGRLEEHVELALAGHEVVELRREQRACLVGPAVDRPGLAQLQADPLALHRLLRRVRRIDLG